MLSVGENGTPGERFVYLEGQKTLLDCQLPYITISTQKSSRLQIFQNIVTLMYTFNMLKWGTEDGRMGPCVLSTTNAWFLYRMLHRKWNSQMSWFFKRSLFRLFNTDRWVQGQTNRVHPGRKPFWSTSICSGCQRLHYCLPMAETETERKSSCHSSTLRYRKRLSATIKWMQACRAKAWDAHQESTHPHGPVVTRGDISGASTSLYYRYC